MEDTVRIYESAAQNKTWAAGPNVGGKARGQN